MSQEQAVPQENAPAAAPEESAPAQPKIDAIARKYGEAQAEAEFKRYLGEDDPAAAEDGEGLAREENPESTPEAEIDLDQLNALAQLEANMRQELEAKQAELDARLAELNKSKEPEKQYAPGLQGDLQRIADQHGLPLSEVAELAWTQEFGDDAPESFRARQQYMELQEQIKQLRQRDEQRELESKNAIAEREVRQRADQLESQLYETAGNVPSTLEYASEYAEVFGKEQLEADALAVAENAIRQGVWPSAEQVFTALNDHYKPAIERIRSKQAGASTTTPAPEGTNASVSETLSDAEVGERPTVSIRTRGRRTDDERRRDALRAIRRAQLARR